ncbi:hypothetical protein [Rhodococcus koreensis]|uniref:hypothetical protein n=1 Tax=Rhodococcus koreensis TaxID=99653 RepID=UPI00366BA77A
MSAQPRSDEELEVVRTQAMHTNHVPDDKRRSGVRRRALMYSDADVTSDSTRRAQLIVTSGFDSRPINGFNRANPFQ